MHLLRITVELMIGFIALFSVTKILGKATLSQITAFDFISAIVLGEFVGNALYDKAIGILTILYTVVIWGVMIYIVEWITQKYRGSRAFLEGKPTIIIRNGRMDREAMKKEKLDINMLQNLLRHKDVFSVREVDFAILETDGTVSVLKKSKYDVPKNEDLQQPQKPVYLPVNIINDGEADYQNMKRAGLNEEWLMKELKRHHIDRIQDVFYAEWKKDEGLYLEKKE
ncbi:DUF421 domain-containing protein [Sporolactobacillus spathodeae]|uniref:Uncharacterized membrane protein YcaP (DUF421 family) n=1 Tax=Sporolactobacillus spathodeae TaxID=1465502 RepID=A0ABS2Q915_9BACL|nr:DUF421 domain-containing protein [Sporolactobacillus spathodeae]MBM7657462.1 uncharacterized membrane protein YcaP (DUF421 family) [Sporolactobacillus spathodeae]